MAFKALIFLFASFLVLFPTAFSSNEEQLLEGEVRTPPLVSLKAPPVPLPPTTPAPPLQSPVVPPPTPGPQIKSPVAPPLTPVYKQPTTPPPPPPPSPKVKSPPSPPPPSAPPPAVPAPPPKPKTTKDCFLLCQVRCKLHSRIKVCLRTCVSCCDRCKCVPPGQSGNREKCGKCYTNMTTHGGRPKCP